MVKAAKKVRAVYDVNPKDAVRTPDLHCSIKEEGHHNDMLETNILRQVWPVSHINDTTAVYVELLKSILSGKNPDYGKNGYYLASSGSVAWIDIYTAMAKSLAKHKVVNNEAIKKADDAALEMMGQALNCSKEQVAVQLGGT